MTEPLRLMLYDPTCKGSLPLTGLSDSWRWGGLLYRVLGRIDAFEVAAGLDGADHLFLLLRLPKLRHQPLPLFPRLIQHPSLLNRFKSHG